MDSSLLGKVDGLQGVKMIIVGDVGVDEYVIGHVRRISPEAPVPVLEVENEDKRLGLATNVAQNISSLGGTPLLVGVIGQDEGAETLKKLLTDAKVSTEHLIVDEARPTTRKLRVMAAHNHIVRVDYEQRQFLSEGVSKKLIAEVERLLPEADALIIQDYAKGVLSEESIQKIIDLTHSHGKKVMVDPNRSTPLSYYHGADMMTPNNEEAVILSQLPLDDLRRPSDSLKEVGEALMGAIGSERVVITRGKEGMSLFEDGGIKHVPTFARQVYDVTGAGDTVIAALSLAWASGLSLEDSCLLANYAAGVVVGKIGCVPCSRQELIEYIQSH